MATFRTGQQTHQVVLPQRPALESVPADTPRIGNETGHGHRSKAVPGAEHGRGETTGTSPGTGGVTPEPLRAGEQHREVRTVHPSVFVLDKHHQPLQPCPPARARKLLTKGRAVVHRHTPFTIRFKDRTVADSQVEAITQTTNRVLVAGCAGRGSSARTRPDKHGFPRLRLPRTKGFFGFATGDLVRAVVPKGKKKGTHTGRVAVRATGNFNITTAHGTVQGINHRHVRSLQRSDGYAYTTGKEQGVSSRP